MLSRDCDYFLISTVRMRIALPNTGQNCWAFPLFEASGDSGRAWILREIFGFILVDIATLLC